MRFKAEHLTFAALLAAVVALAAAAPAAAQTSDEEFIMREMNMEMRFPTDFWDIGRPGPNVYFWDATQIKFDFFATSRTCDIDVFMLLERDKKGSVAAYSNSEKEFYRERNITSVKQGFEYWAGDHGPRVVGYVIGTGPGSQIGVMSNRQATMGSVGYLNKTYSIVNNGNLLTMVVSAPKSSWDDSSCSGEINKLISSFRVNGEPDYREEGIANYYENKGIPLRSNVDNIGSYTGSSGSSRRNSTPPRPSSSGGGDCAELDEALLRDILGQIDDTFQAGIAEDSDLGRALKELEDNINEVLND